MKGTILADNRTNVPELESEHGLSVYFETETKKFLLDTGASDLFIRNAQKLNINLSDVDYVFISHGHADHTGGLPFFLEINSKAKIILSPEILKNEYYSIKREFRKISISFDFEKYQDRLLFVDNDCSMVDSVFICKNSSDKFPRPSGNRYLFKNGKENTRIADDFAHELIFVAGREELFVYTGCAHNGILNILETVKSKFKQPLNLVLGGFHLPDEQDDAVYESGYDLENLSRLLKRDYPLTGFVTGHCTGDNSFEKIKPVLGDSCRKFFVGYSF